MEAFATPATTPAVHEVAARLLRTGIDPAAVARQLWDRAPFGYLGLLSDVLGRATLEPAAAGGHGLVWTTISCADPLIPPNDAVMVAAPLPELTATPALPTPLPTIAAPLFEELHAASVVRSCWLPSL